MRLRLQPNPHMLNRRRQHCIRDTGKGTRGVVLGISQRAGAGGALLEPAACGVEGAELDGDAGADAEEGGERAFVEG